jgi:DNA repair exonuclease SbcCD ATPase subunit
MNKLFAIFCISLCFFGVGYSQGIESVTPQKVIDFYFPNPPCDPCEKGKADLLASAQREIDFVKSTSEFKKTILEDRFNFQNHCQECEKCSKFASKTPEPVQSTDEGSKPTPVQGPLDSLLKKFEERFNKNDETLQSILKENQELKGLLDRLPSELIGRFDKAQESVEGIRSSLARLIDSIVRDREDFKKEFNALKSLIERIKPFDQEEVAGLRTRIGDLIEEVRQNREQNKAYEGLFSNLGKRIEEFRNENNLRAEALERRFSPLIELTSRLEESIKNLAQAMGWLLLAAGIAVAIAVIALAAIGAVYTKISKKMIGG